MSSAEKYKCTLELTASSDSNVLYCSIHFSPNFKMKKGEEVPFVDFIGLHLLRAAYLMASEPEFAEGLKALLELFPGPEETEDEEADA